MTTTSFETALLRIDMPEIHPGDTVRVQQRIKEGEKERLSMFEGLVIAKKHGQGITGTFTVRKVVDGIGVERIFPLHSPVITKIEVVRKSNIRRAKLYYIRERAARDVRKKMKAVWVEAGAPADTKNKNETESAAAVAEKAE